MSGPLQFKSTIKFLLSFLLVSVFVVGNPVVVSALDWAQDAGNPQRTGYIPEEPVEPWTYQWSFNGSDSSGGVGNHSYNAPAEARTVLSLGKLFVPAGAKGIYALSLTNGATAWNFVVSGVRFNATPAIDSVGIVYIGGTNGVVYRLNAATGAQLGSYNAGSPIEKALLLANNALYAVSNDGKLHKINTQTMTAAWVYTSGSTVATLPSYSSSRDSVIFATDDLYVHSVIAATGVRKWRVKPTPNNPGDSTQTATTTFAGSPLGTQFERGYPVIAEKSGIVLLRMQLPADDIYAGPNNGRFGMDNNENRTWLTQNPRYKNLFALNLDTGAEQFISAVGFGSMEDLITGRSEGYGVMPTQPVVKDLGNGKEVVYVPFRSAQTTPATDFRWSGHMGEMVLDNTTVTGLVAGDLRFVKMNSYSGYGGNSPTHIVDEQAPLTVAGNTLFYAHWAASTSVKITNRSDSLGLSYTSPIQTSLHPPVMRALQSISCKDTTTHWTGTCTNLSFVTDGGRYFNGPGWWSYWAVADPPGWKFDQALALTGGSTGIGTSYSAGFLPRYTYVANGYIVVEGNGGDIMVFRHSGTVATTSPTSTVMPTATPDACPSDINLDLLTDISDFSILVANYLKPTPTNPRADINKDGIVDLDDYGQIVANYLKLCP